MHAVELKKVGRHYGEGSRRNRVLEDLDLHVAENEFVAVLGFSGAGKTTLVSLVAGLEFPDAGEVLVGGEKVTGPGADRGVVFQNYSLLPWFSVYGNIALAVRSLFPAMPAAERHERVMRYIEMVNLTHAKDRRPAELSGGMRQRVSVARALASEPRLLLMDEPFSALDALTRGSLQTEVERIWRKDRRTVLMITNDVDEGILLADRILVLTPGPGAKVGAEFRVDLERPRNRTALNHSPVFKKLRGDIMEYLLDISPGKNRRAAALAARVEAAETAPEPALSAAGA